MKPKKLGKIFILLLIVSVLPTLMVWLHRKMVYGNYPALGSFFLFIIILNLIPVFIIYYSWLKRNWFADDRQEAFALFTIGALCWLVSWVLSGNVSLDFLWHSSLYTISYSSALAWTFLVFLMYAVAYYYLPLLTGREFNIHFTRIHFWVSFIFLNILLVVRNTGAIPGAPQNYNEYVSPRFLNAHPDWVRYSQFLNLNRFTFYCLCGLLTAQVLALFNLIIMFLKPGKKIPAASNEST